MSSEGWRIWSFRLVVQNHWSTHQVSPFWWLYGTCLTPLILIAIDSLYSHQPWGSPHSHQVKSSDQDIFPFLSYFPMMSHCFIFITHFSFWFIICFIMAVLKRNFLESSSDSWWAITTDLRMLLSCSGFPLMYIRRLSCLRERTF